jgi:hypothetical protein
VVEGRRQREDAVEGDEPVGRLEADDAAAGGGDADRSARVGPERRVCEAGGERRSRAAARAAGDSARGDRVGDGAEVRVLGGDAVGELVEVRLPDVDVAFSLELGDCRGGPLRDVVGEDDRPVGRGEPGGVEEVLDR